MDQVQLSYLQERFQNTDRYASKIRNMSGRKHYKINLKLKKILIIFVVKMVFKDTILPFELFLFLKQILRFSIKNFLK